MGKFDTRKLDKVETVPRYRVESTVETHDQRQGGKKKDEDEYSETGGVKGWQKFHTDARNRKALKLRQQDILKIIFNQVFLQKGLVIVDANIHLINNQIIEHVHLFSTKVDTYWKLKMFKAGDEIPKESLVPEKYVEVSVQEKGSSTRAGEEHPPADTAGKPAQSKFSLISVTDKKTGKLNLFAVIFYTILFIGLILVFYSLL